MYDGSRRYQRGFISLKHSDELSLTSSPVKPEQVIRLSAYRAEDLSTPRLLGILSQRRFADSFENADRAEPDHVSRVCRGVKAHTHMARRFDVIDLIWLDAIQQFDKVGLIGDITVMKKQLYAVDVWVLIQVVNVSCVERRGATDDTMHLVSFGEQ